MTKYPPPERTEIAYNMPKKYLDPGWHELLKEYEFFESESRVPPFRRGESFEAGEAVYELISDHLRMTGYSRWNELHEEVFSRDCMAESLDWSRQVTVYVNEDWGFVTEELIDVLQTNMLKMHRLWRIMLLPEHEGMEKSVLVYPDEVYLGGFPADDNWRQHLCAWREERTAYYSHLSRGQRLRFRFLKELVCTASSNFKEGCQLLAVFKHCFSASGFSQELSWGQPENGLWILVKGDRHRFDGFRGSICPDHELTSDYEYPVSVAGSVGGLFDDWNHSLGLMEFYVDAAWEEEIIIVQRKAKPGSNLTLDGIAREWRFQITPVDLISDEYLANWANASM